MNSVQSIAHCSAAVVSKLAGSVDFALVFSASKIHTTREDIASYDRPQKCENC
jgi:hypothetical protein